MSEYLEANRDLWDGWTEIHAGSAFYDVAAFRTGGLTLKPIELAAIGDAGGRELLHLQCHFGLDTMSWARLGARATGVDFSPRAISLARSLAAELDIAAEFRCADVCDLPAEWTDRFDIVVTSYGVLPWLPDLRQWGQVIARVLRPGGSFHLIEFHPLATMFDDDGRTLLHPYFHSRNPVEHRVEGSYADPAAAFSHSSFEWSHSLADVHMALIGAGLAVREFREYPFSPFGCYPYLEELEPDRWVIQGAVTDMPLTFSIHAQRER